MIRRIGNRRVFYVAPDQPDCPARHHCYAQLCADRHGRGMAQQIVIRLSAIKPLSAGSVGPDRHRESRLRAGPSRQTCFSLAGGEYGQPAARCREPGDRRACAAISNTAVRTGRNSFEDERAVRFRSPACASSPRQPRHRQDQGNLRGRSPSGHQDAQHLPRLLNLTGAAIRPSRPLQRQRHAAECQHHRHHLPQAERLAQNEGRRDHADQGDQQHAGRGR